MIPGPSITAWALVHPWPGRAQVEQDLLLARLLVAVYEHPQLRDELVFRGGTCLHQLHLAAPRRYSEDLDFVRRSNTGIGPILDALREVADQVGLTVKGTDVTRFPKMRLRAPSEDDPMLPLTIKIEINTYETSPARTLIRLPFQVSSAWFTGDTGVLTFTPEELVSTKLRALYERSKGRDLFDLWLSLTELRLAPRDIVECFGPYRPQGYTQAIAVVNLDRHLANESFRRDLDNLVTDWPEGYDVDAAADLVKHELFSLL